MANFGVLDLRLVLPEAGPQSSEAHALATHGGHILDEARHFATLQEALADTLWVAATSARTGGLYRTQNVIPLKTGMEIAVAKAQLGRIAFVFGPEDHGLTNDEVSLCHRLLTIPANPSYDILNLSQAAMLVLYEWFQATANIPVQEVDTQQATVGELNAMLTHLEDALRAIHYVWGDKGPALMHALRHMLLRAQPTVVENKLLHGLARQMLWYVNHHLPIDKKPQPPGKAEAEDF